MKKQCISLILIGIIVFAIGLGWLSSESYTTEYLRMHVRANSNSVADQSVKYNVRDITVEYLTPYIAQCDSKQKAMDTLNAQKTNVEKLIDEFLIKKGFCYKSRVKIDNEYFPTRVYEDCTLKAGFYDAVIIELGDGLGDNWWCVVYPPLCFTSDKSGIKYRSKILEIINNFKAKSKS